MKMRNETKNQDNQAGAQAPAKKQKDMKEQTETKERMRKAYAPKGTRTQTMVTFRCDNDNLEWLQQQANKGRTLNDLIAAARKSS